MNDNSLDQLQTIIDIQFKDQTKLHQALVHRSYLNENRSQDPTSNERYEFLGDAVLELWASDKLFCLFPQLAEGDLTNLRALVVRTENLAAVAQTAIDLGQFILLSRGEEANGGRHNSSILADTFEAIIGSIYLDQGMAKAQQFLEKFVTPSINILSQQKVYKDAKSLFQEMAQAKKGITPRYETINESGPDHKKTFEVGVFLNNQLIATGTGPSKQSAQEDASTKATKILNDLV